MTVQDFDDLVRLLEEHPEWRAELRRLVFTDDVLALPQIVRELAEAQLRTEERLRALVERQDRAEERLTRLEVTVQGLADRVEALVQSQQRMQEAVEALVRSQQRMQDTLGSMKGRLLELTYHEKAGAYFGPLLRRLRVVEPHTLEDTLEAGLMVGEFRDVLRLDLLISGRPRHQPDVPEIWLAVEVSSVADQGDVDRAARRASLLRRAGYRAVPAVAGEQVTRDAEEAARSQNVALVQDGQVAFWDEALAAWVT
jgi:hypothetical protein